MADGASPTVDDLVERSNRHPEVREAPVEAPIVVAGMLRTGTTILCELLAAYPANRPRSAAAGAYDLQYQRFVADPIAEVARMYDHFGLTYSAEAESAMRAHLAAGPQGRHGPYRYSLADCGLSEGEVRERFARYCERFDMAREEAP